MPVGKATSKPAAPKSTPKATAKPPKAAKPAAKPSAKASAKPSAKPESKPASNGAASSGTSVSAEAKVKPSKRQAAMLKKAGWNPKGANTVSEFQKSRGLSGSGSMDKQTGMKLKDTFDRMKQHNKQNKGDRFFGEGQRGAGIKTHEQRLRSLGYDVGKADGIFDKQTAAAVNKFKRDQKIKQTNGALGERSLQQLKSETEKMGHAPWRSRLVNKKTKAQARKLDGITGDRLRKSADGKLSVGAKGRAVRNIQEHLRRAGFNPKKTNGTFDERTAGALKHFQRKSGLSASGELDAKTWKKLKSTYLYAKSGTSPAQKKGERSGAVRNSQKMLKKLGLYKGPLDGKFGASTQKASRRFERKHRGLGEDGSIGAGQLKSMRRAISARSARSGKISARGRQQMANLANVAQAGASGRRPMGWCLKRVQDYLDVTKYGNGQRVPRLPYARNFAEYLNAGKRYDSMGLRKLPITNPYEAPRGSIVVVRPGTPGTSHPTAGDIVVAGGNGAFYNDGMMGYGGSGNFPKGNNYVLGVYAPK